MNKLTLLSLVAATVLFTACNDKAKDAAADATSAIVESAKETATTAVDATKEAATKAADAAKAEAEKLAALAVEKAEAAKSALAAKASEVKAAAEKKATEAANALKERAASVAKTATAAVTPENAVGKAAYAKCAGCHGADGKTKALGKSAAVAGQTVAVLEEALHGYKAGTRNVSGMGMLMKGQVASMDDATIKAVSEYMSGL